MTKPKVIFVCRYNYALTHPDRYVSYNQKSAENNINAMFNYFSDVKKKAVNMFDYYAGKINKTERVNLVLENGKYAKDEDIEKRKKNHLKYFQKSNLWQGIISFDNEYIDQSIELKELEQKMVKEIIPKFLKYCGFKDKEKMAYQVALHTNTENYHFHISFMEKEANYYGSNGKIIYRRKGKFTEKEMNYLKREVVHTIDRHREFTPLVVTANEGIDDLKKYFKPTERNFILKNIDDLVLEENILVLGEMLYEKRKGKKSKIKYNSINDKKIKELTKNIKKYLFKDKNSELYKKEAEFKESLSKINDYFSDLNKDINASNKKVDSGFSKKKEEYIDNYIYNAIVNHASYKYSRIKEKKNYLKENDIIQEVILKQYRKSKKKSKYSILKRYLESINKNNVFQNKHKIEQSLKKINSEMEDAIEEFSKLFKENDLDYRLN